MKHAAIVVSAVVLLGAVGVVAIARRSDRSAERRAVPARVMAAVHSSEPQAAVETAPLSEAVPRLPDGLAKPESDPVFAKAERALSQVDWKLFGRLMVEQGEQKAGLPANGKDMAEAMRAGAAIMEAMALLQERPDLMQKIGEAIYPRFMEGYLGAMGLSLDETQRAQLAEFCRQEVVKDAGGLQWNWLGGAEGLPESYDWVGESLNDSLRTAEGVRGFLTPEQMAVYVAHQPAGVVSSEQRKEIGAVTSAERVQKTAAYWVERYEVPEAHRETVQRLAQSYYSSYQALHQSYAQADYFQRLEIWKRTLEVQRQAEREIQALTPAAKSDVMADFMEQRLITFRE